MRIRRRARAADDPGRDAADDAEQTDDGPLDGEDADVEPEEDADRPALAGPYDVDELDELEEQADAAPRVDLGSLLVPPTPGRELRMQVEEKSGAVQSVALTGQDGALELRAFAAPRHGDLWGEVRPQIATDMTSRGGTATEREGRFGTELVCAVQVRTKDGRTGTQPSRIIGVNGPRWLLRATLLGKPAVEPDEAGEWEDLLASVVVRRGSHAMPVGEALPLTLPENARRLEPRAR